ncbi:MAG: hypothetical protein ABI411_00960 [Tahibacter sp.]
MRSTVLCAMLTLLMPLAASAQSLAQQSASAQTSAMLLDRLLDTAVATAPLDIDSTRVIPLWSTSDGRILAAIALANPALSPLEPASPQVANALDWQLIDATALFAGRLDIRLGSQLVANARFSQTPLLLSESDALAESACIGFGNDLGAGRYACPNLQQKRYLGQLYSGNIGTDWTRGPLSLDVNLGLAWLNPGTDATATPLAAWRGPIPGTVASIPGTLPTLVMPGNDLYRLDSSATLGASGRWAFPSGQSIGLGANFGHIRLIPDASGTRSIFNQTALSLGVGSETLSGNITGRIFSPLATSTPGQQRWTGIDLGVTWHTPWQADLSVGAQNLWTSPPLTGTDADSQARTPYVQYRQDL